MVYDGAKNPACSSAPLQTREARRTYVACIFPDCNATFRRHTERFRHASEPHDERFTCAEFWCGWKRALGEKDFPYLAPHALELQFIRIH